MSSIANQPLMASAAPRQNYLSDAQFSNYIKKQSISAYESLDAGVSIQTKEGDLVTLTSSSYAQLDAHMYDSRGILQTQSGRTMVNQNTREITLASGESFSFSVVGELSETELADIENIVKDIDGIISEMVQGDMDDAVDKALSMGGYDTVSMYAADISYAKSYQMASEATYQARAQTMESIQEPNPEMPLEEEIPAAYANIPFTDNYTPGKHKDSSIKNINKFVEKITEHLAKNEDKLVEKAQKPINKLFGHHLENIRQNREDKNNENQSIYTAIADIKKKIDTFIEQMTKDMFKDNFGTLLE